MLSHNITLSLFLPTDKNNNTTMDKDEGYRASRYIHLDIRNETKEYPFSNEAIRIHGLYTRKSQSVSRRKDDVKKMKENFQYS